MTCSLLVAATLLGTLGQNGVQNRQNLFGYLMDYSTVLSGDRGSVMDKDVVVARTKSQWDKMRAKLGVSDDKDAELSKLHGPLGAMDWGREQIVFARSGEKPTGGFVASVYKLTRTSRSDSWRIEISVSPPKEGSMNMEVLTNPYVVFRMRKQYGVPEFQVREAKPGK